MQKSTVSRSALLGSVGACLFFAAPALAQEVVVDRQDGPTEVSDIIVTGTRLGSSALNASQPIQSITAEQVQLQGVTEISDLLDRSPALISSASSAQANGGAATLNLRGMGTNRTLVLVNGRRHVAGVQGSAAVDVSSIPSGLIQQVDVLTGGASAVYGSDAVTGVVNFILRDDFVGTEVDVQGGISSALDGERVFGSVLHGRSFGGGRGNVTVGLQGERRKGITYGDRPWAVDNRVADDYPNPELYFQAGDPLPPGVTPEQALGRTILVGGNPRFPGTSPLLISRAQEAPARAYIASPRWNISSTSGIIGFDPWGWGFAEGAWAFLSDADLDGDGRNDCTQSFGGRGGPGWVTGCWVVDNDTGQVRPFRDGVFAGSQNQSFGDGAAQTFNGQSLIPEEESLHLNLLANYEFSPAVRPYLEAKMSYNKGTRLNPYNTFDDGLPIQLDNPFIPQQMRDLIDQEIALDPSAAGGVVTLARDHADIFDPMNTTTRRTYRAVLGVDGDIGSGWSYDLSATYGRTEGQTRSATRLDDRFFAAVDAVDEGEFRTGVANGNIVCRSTLDPTAFPRYSFLTDQNNFGPGPSGTIANMNGFVTFTPGAGSPCQPLNLFGENQASEAALAFQNYYAVDEWTIEQAVLSGVMVGDTGRFFSLPGGPIGIAVGAEWREERSTYTPDAFVAAGYNFQGRATASVAGSFNVKEAFAEVSLPILADQPFAHLLTVNLAGRAGDYSTVGSVSAWKADMIWAPIPDIRFRGGYATTIRAPNIGELFTPLTSIPLRPIDPCDEAQVNQGSEFREQNCRADLGIAPGDPYTFQDPLTAQFAGQTGGNPDLEEETSESYTIGMVLRPRFLPNFSLTVDYWNIRIENAIAALTSQNIVDACYDAPDLNNQYCDLFTRNRNSASPTYLGFNYLLTTQLNFSALEASGYDFSANYRINLSDYNLDRFGALTLGVSGTYLEDRNNFPFPDAPERPNPVKFEQNSPEWAVNTSIRWDIERFTFSLFSSYLSRQTLSGTEIENVDNFTPAYTDSVWIHDASVRFPVRDNVNVTLGVNNLLDQHPYYGSVATPVSALGRYFFARVSSSF